MRVGVVTFPGSLDDAGEAEPRQGTEDGLALRVEDLGLGHHVDDVSGHGRAFRSVGAPERALWGRV